MSGLKPMKVYLYDTDGKYLREFISISEFARTFQMNENIFSGRNEDGVYEFEDGRIAALYRIGREGIKKYRRYKNSHYTKKYVGRIIAESVLKKNNKLGEVEVYNLDNELIATFKNVYFAGKLLKFNDTGALTTKNFNEEGLKFKIK